MLNTSARLLRLLALLQSRPTWTAPELAERLTISTRTVRADIERLRELGYPITGTRGFAGGYRLGAGAQMPPLLLDDDEAVAVAVSLALAPRNIAGVEESAARALSKLEQVIPSRLRQQVAALRATTEQPRAAQRSKPTETPASSADLAAIATAIHVGEWCRFRYTRVARGETTAKTTADLESRRVEPYRLVSWRSRWYLVAFDLDRDDWRTFRVDRMRLGGRTFRPFTARSLPEDASALVLRGIATAGWNARARIIVHAPATSVLERIDPTVGTVEVLTESTSALLTGADSLERIAAYVGMLGFDFNVDYPDELGRLLRVVGTRYLAAAPTSPTSTPPSASDCAIGPGKSGPRDGN
ncbi:WYL domain-containing protein [Streptomyces sp. ISL-90]|nr:WYL domain-containing protein [Streptomyces sp. ISL-90]